MCCVLPIYIGFSTFVSKSSFPQLHRVIREEESPVQVVYYTIHLQQVQVTLCTPTHKAPTKKHTMVMIEHAPFMYECN